jgi:hypothetical protein
MLQPLELLLLLHQLPLLHHQGQLRQATAGLVYEAEPAVLCPASPPRLVFCCCPTHFWQQI